MKKLTEFYIFDKFTNSKKFQDRCDKTDFKCKCGRNLVEINKKKRKTYSKIKELYGYYCLNCDKDKLGLIEWRIKIN